MSVIVITGASGFVGANLARYFAERGDDVHLFLRASSNLWRLVGFSSYVRHNVDLLDASSVGELLGKLRPEIVFHLATYGAYETQATVSDVVRTNIECGINLMDAARLVGVERFVNTGSSSEYGYKDHAPDEDEEIQPNSLYAVTKAAATYYGQYLASHFQFHVTTLRLYSVYGPFEEPSRLIPRIIVRANAGSYPHLVSPNTARDFIHVDDVVRCFECVVKADIQPGRIFNVGTGVQTSLADVVAVAAETFGIRDSPVWGSMPERRWDTRIWVADSRRAGSEIGWYPGIPFSDGFRRAAKWLTEDLDRFRFYERFGTLPP